MARQPDDRQAERDWVDWVTRVAGALGMNPVRVRWKLEGMRRRRAEEERAAESRAEHLRYRHKICPQCGRLSDRNDRTCARCGATLHGPVVELLRRLGLRTPALQSVSAILGVLIALVFARCIQAEWPEASIFSFKVETLYRHGGHWPPAVARGEVWRWLTAVFLHAGLWHIGFNLYALSVVGPAVEELYGRGRMILLFVVLGVVANIGSYLWGLRGVGIGASGAIMGLCGLAAGWGHRDGTTVGRTMRAFMVKWAAYTMIFGFAIGADNAAHAVGFVAGGVLGLVLEPVRSERRQHPTLRVVQGLTGAALALAATLLCLFPQLAAGIPTLDVLGAKNTPGLSVPRPKAREYVPGHGKAPAVGSVHHGAGGITGLSSPPKTSRVEHGHRASGSVTSCIQQRGGVVARR